MLVAEINLQQADKKLVVNDNIMIIFQPFIDIFSASAIQTLEVANNVNTENKLQTHTHVVNQVDDQRDD